MSGMQTRKGWFLALFLSLAVAMQCILLNQRQENGMASLQEDMVSSLRSEFRFAMSSYLWKKLDFYMHYSEWQQEETEEGTAYYSSLINTKEFRPLIEWSVSIDPSFTEAISILANTFAVSFGKVKEAREVLRSSIQNHPSQKRIFRLYGELGLIAYQVDRNYPQAVRYFRRCFETLSSHPPRDWNSEDRFNIRNYGLSAALSAFFTKERELAYEFHRLSGFEEGPEDFQKVMDEIMEQRGEHRLRDTHPLRRQPGKGFHDHDHEPGETEREHDHEHGEAERELDPETEELIRERIEAYKSDADLHLRMIPRLNPHFFFPISWKLSAVLFGLCLLQIGIFVFWRSGR